MHRTSRPRIPGALVVAVLTLLIALQPVTTDLYLPALPALRAHFGVSIGALQLTLSGREYGLRRIVDEARAPLGIELDVVAEIEALGSVRKAIQSLGSVAEEVAAGRLRASAIDSASMPTGQPRVFPMREGGRSSV